jgi:hypothetical protein
LKEEPVAVLPAHNEASYWDQEEFAGSHEMYISQWFKLGVGKLLSVFET